MAEESGFSTVRVEVGGTELCIRRRDLSEQQQDDPAEEREEEETAVDPFLFDSDYSLEGFTGFMVWEGSYALLDLLRSGEVPLEGRRVLELGAGTGILGLSAAALGAHALITDLASVVEGSLAPNVARNGGGGAAPAGGAWPSAVAVGSRGGSARAAPLDWTLPLGDARQTVAGDPREADVVLAADTVWLLSLVDPFVSTLAAVLSGGRAEACYWAFRERAKATSEHFVSSAALLEAMARHGLRVELLRRLKHGVAEAPGKPGGDILVHRVTLAPRNQ